MATNKETPGAATPGETISRGRDKYYTAQELDELLLGIAESVNSRLQVIERSINLRVNARSVAEAKR
ncbi:hypothetical protein [Corynebacterium accolens]|uniref:hypothetical protein n=1 Tax=Corynebacterium accolens TaxID=38284 RepID=UPI00254BFF08|nr:hypothetical protein [Corynebacterium accolens]MDK8503708.1 hypothetical protein [Corynebacterium accolens]MDK8660998.1 hypothetical protein [Corynebacterium accolens]